MGTIGVQSLSDLHNLIRNGSLRFGIGLYATIEEDRRNPPFSAQIKQCHYCQGYGHTHHTCPRRLSGQTPLCMYCQGPHRPGLCADRNNRSKWKCALCHKNHASNSIDCQIRRQQYDQIAKKPLPMQPTHPATTTPIPIHNPTALPTSADYQQLLKEVKSMRVDIDFLKNENANLKITNKQLLNKVHPQTAHTHPPPINSRTLRVNPHAPTIASKPKPSTHIPTRKINTNGQKWKPKNNPHTNHKASHTRNRLKQKQHTTPAVQQKQHNKQHTQKPHQADHNSDMHDPPTMFTNTPLPKPTPVVPRTTKSLPNQKKK